MEIVGYSADEGSSAGPLRGDALVLPGRGYSIDHPLLAWTLRMLHGAGWWCTTVRWSVDDLHPDGAVSFVESVAEQLHARRRTDGPSLVVAKSLGTLAMGWARGLALPAVWLTPLLSRPETAAVLAGYPAPTLLVGGTRDPLWDSAVAAGSGADVLEIPGADHSLVLPLSWETSHDVEGTVVRAVADFADHVAPR